MTILYRSMEIIFTIILILAIYVISDFSVLSKLEKCTYIYIIVMSSLMLIVLVPPDVEQIIKYLKKSKEERQFYKEDLYGRR